MEVLTESVLPREKTVLLRGRTDEMMSREVPEQTRALFLHHSLQDVPPGCQSQCNSYQFLLFQLSSKWHHSSDYFHSVHLHTLSAANTKSEPSSQQDQGAGQGSPPSRRMSMHLPPALRSACVWHKTKAVITIDHKTRCHFTPFNVFKFSLVISAGQGVSRRAARVGGPLPALVTGVASAWLPCRRREGSHWSSLRTGRRSGGSTDCSRCQRPGGHRMCVACACRSPSETCMDDRGAERRRGLVRVTVTS